MSSGRSRAATSATVSAKRVRPAAAAPAGRRAAAAASGSGAADSSRQTRAADPAADALEQPQGPVPGELVARVVAQAAEGQDVLDVGALDEPGPGVELELDAGLGEGELQVDGVVVGAVEDRDLPRRAPLGEQVGDPLGHEGGLVLHRGQVGDHRGRARRRPLRAQALAVGVAGRERLLRERDDLGGRAVVRLEREDARALGGGEALDDLRVGAAPGVDGLVGVGDRDQVRALGGQGLDQARLDRVHVVQLVDQHPAVGLGQPPAHPRVLLDQPRREDEEVGVVERRHRALALGVPVGDGDEVLHAVGQARVAVEHDLLERPAGLGRQRGEADDGRRLGQRRAGLAPLQHRVARHRGQLGLVLAVEDREGGRDADDRAVAVQQAPADGVEGAGRDAAQVGAAQARGPVDHLPRRPAGEGDQHDRLGRRAGLDQVGQRGDDRARLARSGRGQHQRPAARPLDRGELLLVEHRAQALRDPGPSRRRPQAVDAAAVGLGRQRIARGAGVPPGLLGLDVRRRGRRRLPAGVAVGGGHGPPTLSRASDATAGAAPRAAPARGAAARPGSWRRAPRRWRRRGRRGATRPPRWPRRRPRRPPTRASGPWRGSSA